MIIDLADAKPLDLFDFPVVQAILFLTALLAAWLVFDTRRVLRNLTAFFQRWSPIRSPWVVNPEKAGWIWFYRIDAAVVMVAIVQMFVHHYAR